MGGNGNGKNTITPWGIDGSIKYHKILYINEIYCKYHRMGGFLFFFVSFVLWSYIFIFFKTPPIPLRICSETLVFFRHKCYF